MSVLVKSYLRGLTDFLFYQANYGPNEFLLY